MYMHEEVPHWATGVTQCIYIL